MTTTAAISPVIRNVLSVAEIQPMAVTASQMARITPRIVHIIRPMYPVCASARMIRRQVVVTRTAGRRQRTASLCRVNPAHRAAAGGAQRNVTEPLVTTSK